MGIGTVGYFDFGEGGDNVIGLTTNLGWQRQSANRFIPYVTYRGDIIFSDKTQMINALNLGISINF